MRDLSKVADKIQGILNTGKMNKASNPNPAMTTDQKINKVMSKLEKKGK